MIINISKKTILVIASIIVFLLLVFSIKTHTEVSPQIMYAQRYSLVNINYGANIAIVDNVNGNVFRVSCYNDKIIYIGNFNKLNP